MSKDIPPNPRALAPKRKTSDCFFFRFMEKVMCIDRLNRVFRGEDTKHHEI